MTMKFRDMPIRRKLMIVNLLASGTVLLLTCAAFVAYEFISLHRNMVQSYQTRAEIIAANTTAALAFQNPADATDILAALKNDRRMNEACLYDSQGKLFARYPATAPDSAFPAVPGASGYRGGHLDVFCPVVQGDRALGMVYLQSNLSALTDRYRAYAWLSAAIIAGSILVALLLSRLLERQISGPILALAKVALNISGHRNFSVRARKFGDDELGALTDAFNQMLGEIQAQEKALKASETNYREIFEKANDAIFIHELETGRVLDVNQKAVEMTGYSREELTSAHPADISSGNPSYTMEDAAKWMRKAAAEGPQVFEWQGRHKNGSLHWIEVSLGRAVIGGQDRLLAFFREIGERKKLEETLQTRDFITSVLENIPNMVFVKDAKELRFVMFNKAGEDILGIPRTDLIGKSDYDFFPKDQADFFTAKDRTVLNGRTVQDIQEEPIDTKTNGKRILHTKKIPIRGKDDQPQYLLGISEDITDVKRQQELELYTKALEVSNRELQDFVFVASHDLQEPLRKVQSFGEFLAEEYGSVLEGNGKDYLERMRSAAGRMQTLINDLLTLTRVTTKAKPFEPVELSQVLRDVLSDLEIRIAEKNAKVEVGPLPAIEADATQMRQLFQNLVGNALKFQKPGVPPEIQVEAQTVEGTPGSPRCLIRVKDNGIGFENKYAEQIFKVFERLHGRDEYEGTGIGLAVCRKVVERHGGTITAEGVIGKGSVFSVLLPLKQNPNKGVKL